ncbi:hypothetical protein HDV06_000188 [Boothiomyces sp. JEL0866]|nr:hypothetical protein HDV06_000188 [Boothiomyces sp. JEL0866]
MQIETNNSKTNKPFFSNLFKKTNIKSVRVKSAFGNFGNSKVEQSKTTLVNQSTINFKENAKPTIISRLFFWNKKHPGNLTDEKHKIATIDDSNSRADGQSNPHLVIDDLKSTKSKWFWNSKSENKKSFKWIWKRKQTPNSSVDIQESNATLTHSAVKRDKGKSQSRQSISFVDVQSNIKYDYKSDTSVQLIGDGEHSKNIDVRAGELSIQIDEQTKKINSYPSRSADDIRNQKIDTQTKSRKSIIKSKSLIVPSRHLRKSTSSSVRKTSFSQDLHHITGNFPIKSKTFTENLYASFRYYIDMYGIELVQASSSTYNCDLIDMEHYGIAFVNINWEAYGLKYHYQEFLDYLFADYTQKQLNSKNILYDPNQTNIRIIPKPEKVKVNTTPTDMTDARQIYKSIVDLEKFLSVPELYSKERSEISKLYIQLIKIDSKFIQKYDLNNRMWKNSIYSAIKTVKHTPEFIPLIESILDDYNTLIKLQTKFTGLYYCHRGDLYRYSASYFFPESADYFLNLAKIEYQFAVDFQPANGLFWNQLGIISGIQKKYFDSSLYFIRSLCVKQPFINAKESLLNSLAAGKEQQPFLELVESIYSKVNVDKFDKQLYKFKRKFEAPQIAVPICIGLDYIISTKFTKETLLIMKEYSSKLISSVCEWLVKKNEFLHLQLVLIYCILEHIKLDVEIDYKTELKANDLNEAISQTPLEMDKKYTAFEPFQKVFDASECDDNDNVEDRLGLLVSLLKNKGLVNVAVEPKEKRINSSGAVEFDFEDFEETNVEESVPEPEELHFAEFETEEEIPISDLTLDEDHEINHLLKLKQQLSKSFKLTRETAVFIDTNYLLSNVHECKSLFESEKFTIVISTVVIKELKGLELNTRTCKEAEMLLDYIYCNLHLINIQQIDGTMIQSVVGEPWIDFDSADDAILHQVRQSKGCLVTNDINLRLKARAVGVHVLDSFQI